MKLESLEEIIAECESINEFDRTPIQQAVVELARMVDDHTEFLERL